MFITFKISNNTVVKKPTLSNTNAYFRCSFSRRLGLQSWKPPGLVLILFSDDLL